MSLFFDDLDHFCSDWTEVTRIDLENYLRNCLNRLPDLSTFGSQVLQPLKPTFIESYERPAAILVPFVEVQGEWHILMTKRAAHLAHHAGQVSFPGGKVEANDLGLADAALREAFEEIHLPPDAVQIIGGLDMVWSSTGFIVQPVVGIVKGKNILKDLVLDPAEVDLIFTMPVAHGAKQHNFRLVTRETDGRPNDYWVIEHHEHFIWGLSALVLVDLFRRFGVLARK